MPEPTKLLSVPPVTAMSLRVKSVLISLSWKVTVATSLGPNCVLLALMAMAGRRLSTVMLTVLLASAPSALRLAKLSLNTPEATLTLPVPLLPGVGV